LRRGRETATKPGHEAAPTARLDRRGIPGLAGQPPAGGFGESLAVDLVDSEPEEDLIHGLRLRRFSAGGSIA
jgi:hypothetical protein